MSQPSPADLIALFEAGQLTPDHAQIRAMLGYQTAEIERLRAQLGTFFSLDGVHWLRKCIDEHASSAIVRPDGSIELRGAAISGP